MPAHTSHFLQPLDVGVFKTVKAEWKRIVEAYLVRNSYSSLSNRQFPAMMKDLIANKGFKVENARSGLENTGIFPLNRSKITPNKTAIGAIFQDVTNDKIENCFSGKSTDSQVSLDKTNKINSKHSMNRLSTKEVLLKELDSIKNAVKQASFDINKSVLSVLRDRLKPLSSGKEKGTIIKRTTNYNMTELSAMAQDEATQAAKKRKLDEKEARKVIREKKNWTQQLSKSKSLKKEDKKLLKLKNPENGLRNITKQQRCLLVKILSAFLPPAVIPTISIVFVIPAEAFESKLQAANGLHVKSVLTGRVFLVLSVITKQLNSCARSVNNFY